MMGGHMIGWTEMGGWFGPVAMLVWWGGLAAIIVWAINGVTGHLRSQRHDHLHGATNGTPDSARAILDRRFASGEIDAESYARARRLIEEPVAPATSPRSGA